MKGTFSSFLVYIFFFLPRLKGKKNFCNDTFCVNCECFSFMPNNIAGGVSAAWVNSNRDRLLKCQRQHGKIFPFSPKRWWPGR